MKTNLSKNLDQLEDKAWDAPDFETSLTLECHRLRKVPLQDFTVENFRILIGQKISLPLLVPLALEILIKDPLAEGDFYEGDLLFALAGVPEDYWKANPDDFATMVEIKNEMEILRDTIVEEILPALEGFEF